MLIEVPLPLPFGLPGHERPGQDSNLHCQGATSFSFTIEFELALHPAWAGSLWGRVSTAHQQ
jgi:hypothetical protein